MNKFLKQKGPALISAAQALISALETVYDGPTASELEALRVAWQPYTTSNTARMSVADIAREIAAVEELPGKSVVVMNRGDHWAVEDDKTGKVARAFPQPDYVFASYFAQGYNAAKANKD